MKAGPLDRRITIQRFTLVDDGYGEVETWSDLVTLSAQAVQQSGREFLSSDQIQGEQRVIFRLRWIDGLTVADRVIYRSRAHNIKDVKELGRLEGIELLTVAAV